MFENFPIYEGTVLASCYQVQAFLGEGCFGRVAKCLDVVTDTKMAIKITKDEPFFTERALEEIKILKQLRTLDSDRCNLVKWNGSFLHKGFICLKFELLDLNLNAYMLQRRCRTLSMGEIRPVLQQLTTALLHLECLGIIHADLKPDNIMVVDRRQQPLQVKLIDFGLACHVSKAVLGSCVQSLWYRAPEVMLGLSFMESIDMWSLGVLAAELALGRPLFPGNREYDMIKFIVDTVGQPPDYLLQCGQKSSRFFHSEGSSNQQTWRLRSPEEFARRTGHHFRDTRVFQLNSLDALEEVMCFWNQAEKNELHNFMDLLKKMLLVDKNERITPFKVLEHPFFCVEQHSDSSQDIKDINLKSVTQQLSSREKSVHGLELHSVGSEATTRQVDILLTPQENVCAVVEDEEEEASHIQPEVAVEPSVGCVNMFFERIRKVFSCWFLQQ